MDSTTLWTAPSARLRHTAQDCLPAVRDAAFGAFAVPAGAAFGIADVLDGQPVVVAGPVAAPPPRGAPV